MSNLKNIPQNIQEAINRWKLDNNSDENPQLVKLEKYEDFDSIKHKNFLIEFPPGKIGDKMWKLQFMHNSSVICENVNKQNPSFSPETYINLDHKELKNISKISFLINDFVIDEIYSQMIYIAQNSYKLTPLTYNKDKNKYDKSKMIFLNFYSNNNEIVRKIIYNDNTEKIIKPEDIQYIKY